MVAAVQADRLPAMNVPRDVLDAFDGLTAGEDKKRTGAAMLILHHVDQVLRVAGQEEMPAGVKYIVQRLVSGLASTRLKAREGYFSALCFILRIHPSFFSPPFVLSLLTSKKSATMKAATKDEMRDQLVAELLLCGAVVRSGRARRAPEVMQRVVNQLCAMRTKKSYLDITATQFLVNLMESVEGDTMHNEVWESLQAELKTSVAELSPSQLWLRLVLLRKHRASPPVWLTSTLAPKNHEALAQTLMQKTTTDLPKVHPVLEELVSSLAASRGSSSTSSLLIKFWQVTVGPLQGHTSPGKLQILFHLLRFMVPHLRTAAEFKEVVTSSFVALLLNSLSQPVYDLKEAARGVTSAFVQLVKDNQNESGELQLAVVRALVTPPGSVRFDQLAGHKVLALMVPLFTFKTLKGVTKTLLEVVNEPVKDLEVANRNYASHTLGNLLAQPRACTPQAATWKKKQLMFLLKAVVLVPAQQKEGDTSKDAFFKALGKQVGHIREYNGILLSLVEEVDGELKALEAAGSPSPLNDKGKEQWSRVNSRLAALKGKEYEEGTEADVAKTVFQVLYCQMALHLFVDVTAAAESIEEFITCHKEVMKLGMLKADEEEEEEEGEEDQPNWMEVVTELLLSLMTQEMHLFRSVVQGLFWLLTPLMTATALTLLTDVLDTEKARELVKKEGEEGDEDEDDDEEDEEKEGSEDDDEEEKEGSDDDGDDDDAEDSDGDDDDDDDDKEEEECGEDEDPNLFTLRKKMLDVTGGGIDVDVDMDTVPQEELDRLDERLGALLAEYQGMNPTRKKKKKRKKGGGGGSDDGPQLSADEQSLMHFQTRVCDMLIVYIKAAPSMALQVGLVNPIFKALRTADLDVRQKDLQNKLANVITALEKKKKFNTIGEISVDTWKETVNEFFSFTCQMPERFLSVGQSCYSQLMHCGRLLLGTDEEAVRKPDNFLTTTYISHLETFFTKNHHLPKVQPFCEPCTYTMGGLWQVAATLVRFAFDPEVKVHKQAQALKTLQQLYANKALQGERSRPETAAVEQDLSSKVLKALSSMQSPINGLFVSNLFRLLHIILQMDRRTGSQPNLAWEELRGSVEAFRERISKTALKPFRKEYNVFNEALRGFFNVKKGLKKQGVKRGAGDLNESGNQQENQIKKRKKEKKNSLANNTSPLNAEGGKEEKKKKKKKKNIIGKIAINEDNKDTQIEDDTSKKEEEHSENTPKKVMVNGDDSNTLNGGQENEEKMISKKKKKEKKDKVSNSEDNSSVINQEENVKKKKKKKKKEKLTSTPATIEDNSVPQTQDNLDEEREGQGEKKKKKKKLAVKRKQEQEEEEKAATRGEEEQTAPSAVTTEPTPKKKKKKKGAIEVNGKI